MASRNRASLFSCVALFFFLHGDLRLYSLLAPDLPLPAAACTEDRLRDGGTAPPFPLLFIFFCFSHTCVLVCPLGRISLYFGSPLLRENYGHEDPYPSYLFFLLSFFPFSLRLMCNHSCDLPLSNIYPPAYLQALIFFMNGSSLLLPPLLTRFPTSSRRGVFLCPCQSQSHAHSFSVPLPRPDQAALPFLSPFFHLSEENQ